jgi:hypothetical protein
VATVAAPYRNLDAKHVLRGMTTEQCPLRRLAESTCTRTQTRIVCTMLADSRDVTLHSPL